MNAAQMIDLVNRTPFERLEIHVSDGTGNGKEVRPLVLDSVPRLSNVCPDAFRESKLKPPLVMILKSKSNHHRFGGTLVP